MRDRRTLSMTLCGVFRFLLPLDEPVSGAEPRELFASELCAFSEALLVDAGRPPFSSARRAGFMSMNRSGRVDQ